MRDNSQLIQQPALTICQVFALYGNDNDYTTLGNGSIEIVTDTDLVHSMCHHYIEVSNPEDNEIFMRSRLQSKNVYERQKSTLILWNDPEQVASNNLAISFEDDRTCDIIWRIICQKIGKNYLEINGQEKLEAPNQKNIRYFLEKIKTSYNLVTYHVINSAKFMQKFWQTVDKLNQKNVNNLSGLGLLRELLCRLDVSMMEALLSDPNFKRLLGAFEFETKIDYYNSYKEPSYDYEIIKISPTFKKNFLLFLRAYYVRQHVINFAKDITIELTLLKVIKYTQLEMLNEVILNNTFGKIISAIQQKKKTKDENKQDYDLFVNNVLTFLLESFWSIKSSHAHSFMPIYVEYFNNSKLLKTLVDLLNQGYYKALEVIAGFASIGSKSFIVVYQEDYRNNPGTSLVRSISKQFSQNPHSQIVPQTINFMKVFLRMLTDDKSKFEFFNKTLILSIFISCNKYPERVLTLINFCISQLAATKSMFEHIVKYKYFNKLAQKLEKKQQTKQQTVETIQLVRVVLQCMKQEKIGAEAQKQINESAVSSGIFTYILLRLKQNFHYNNILTSAILECLRIISVLKYNQFTKVVQNFDFGDLSDKKYKTLKKYVDKIGQILEPQQSKDQNNDLGRKRIHQSILEQQQEQKYLQDDKEQQAKDSENISTQNLQQVQDEKKLQSQKEMEAQIRNLLKMKKEQQQKEIEEEEMKRKKQLKIREEKLKAQKNVDNSFNFDVGDLGQLQ